MSYLPSWKLENNYPLTMSDEVCDWWEDIKRERTIYERRFTKYFFRNIFKDYVKEMEEKNPFSATAYTDKETVREKVDVRNLLDSCGITYREIAGKLQFSCFKHDDKRPSASFDLTKKYYYCFSCSEGGDIFTFYSKLNGIGFAQSVEELNRI